MLYRGEQGHPGGVPASPLGKSLLAAVTEVTAVDTLPGSSRVALGHSYVLFLVVQLL